MKDKIKQQQHQQREYFLKKYDYCYYLFHKTKQEQIKMGVFSNFGKQMLVNKKNKQNS